MQPNPRSTNTTERYIMSVTGERSWSMAGKTPKKYESTPLPSKDYDMKLLGSEAKVGKRNEPGKFPYVSVPFEALDTAGDSGKNRKVFMIFLSSLKPGKDGIAMPERESQIGGLLHAVGEEPEFPILEQADEDGNPTPYIDPRAIKQWLLDHDGEVFRAHTKVEKARDGYGPSAKIDRFIGGAEQEAGGAAAEWEPEGESNGAEPGALETETEVAELPPVRNIKPAPAARPTPKPAPRPAPRPVAKTAPRRR